MIRETRFQAVLAIDTFGPCWLGSPMPHKLRVEYPGANYQVTNCGDQREDIFGEPLHMGSWTCVSNLLNEPPKRIHKPTKRSRCGNSA